MSPVKDDEAIELATRKHLKELRTQANLTQSELANRAGVSQPLIARIETETVNPRLSILRSIFSALEGGVGADVRNEQPAQSMGQSTDELTESESTLIDQIATSFDDI